MHRRLALFLSALLAGSTFVALGPSRPAAAWKQCHGAGAMTVTPGLKFPVALNLPHTPVLLDPSLPAQLEVLLGGPNDVHTYVFTLNSLQVTCTHGLNTTATVTGFGVLKGFCGWMSGVGTLAGALYAFVSAGPGLLLFTGHVTGHMTLAAAMGTGSCFHVHNLVVPAFSLANPATLFDVTATFWDWNCTSLLAPDFEVLQRLVTQDVLVGAAHVWADLGMHAAVNAPCVGTPIL